jgi:hypothetical protein
MFFRDKLAIFYDSKHTDSSRMPLPVPGKTAQALRQVSTLPHREPNGCFFLLFLRNAAYFVE